MKTNITDSQITPEQALMKTIENTNLENITIDIGETLFDQLIDDGFLRDIPIVRTFVNISKTIVDIGNYLLLKKILKFLYNLKDIPQKKRKDFIKSLRVDDNELRKIGNNLFLILHRLDDFTKADYLGKAFRAYIEGVIDQDTYFRFSIAIDRLSIHDIPTLISFYKEYVCNNEDALQGFANCGLASIHFAPSMQIGGVSGYCTNNLGEKFLRVVLNEPA